MKATQPSQRKLIWIPTVTVLSGFFPFVLFSMHYGVFWTNTVYDVPLVYNISVMVGDAILLPLINYQVGKLIFSDFALKELAPLKRKIMTWLVVSFLISAIVNLFAHLAWKNDQYSDFISVDKVTFLISGWWHLCFSILEMTVLFLFPLFWYTALRQKCLPGIKRSYRIWGLLFLFSTLAIFDMLMKFFFVYRLTLWATIMTDYFAFVTPTGALLLLIIMVAVKTRYSKKWTDERP